jgi:hypothetical protein
MFFLNLGLGELLAIAGVVSGGIVALYLLDRSKRKQRVPTLRFWMSADVRTELSHRRRIQQPWSLLLQILSILLLLTAIAGPQFGLLEGNGRDHVIVLDTSAWMGSRGARQGTMLMDEARSAALAYLKTVPSRDRVMLVRADALSTPATTFESNHAAVEQAIRDSHPGRSALNIAQAIAYAQSAQRIQAHRAGEIVYAGPGKVDEESATLLGSPAAPPANLRVLSTSTPQENVGLRKIGLRRSLTMPDTWEIFVAVKNYGVRAHEVDLGLQFAKSPAGSQHISLKPGAEEQVNFNYATKVGGFLEARLNIRDALPDDDRALIELPSETSLNVQVYTKEPELLRPLIASNPQIAATFESPDKYDAAKKADVVILDAFAPPTPPAANSIWIDPPAKGSPVEVAGEKKNVKIERWRTETSLGTGLRTADAALETAETFVAKANDIVVADSANGPLIVARPGQHKEAVLGFNPGRGAMKYQLATPLLVANLIRWMAPGAFRRWEVQAGTVGAVDVPVEKGTDPASVKVLNEDNRPLPFTINGNTLQFFAGSSGAVRVQMGDRELVYSLTLPELADATWKVPAGVRTGVPRSLASPSSSPEIWPWLALLGGLGLLVDWLIYGRKRAFRIRPANIVSPLSSRINSWRKAS